MEITFSFQMKDFKFSKFNENEAKQENFKGGLEHNTQEHKLAGRKKIRHKLGNQTQLGVQGDTVSPSVGSLGGQGQGPWVIFNTYLTTSMKLIL